MATWQPTPGLTRGQWQQQAADLGQTGARGYNGQLWGQLQPGDSGYDPAKAADLAALMNYGATQGWNNTGWGNSLTNLAKVALPAVGGYGLSTLGAGGVSGGAGAGGGFGGAGAAVGTPTAAGFFGGAAPVAAAPTAAGFFGAGAAPAVAAGGAGFGGGWAVPAAILGSAGLGVLASQKAAQVQADAANQASQASQAQYAQTREDLAPWRQAGVGALAKLQAGNFQMDPGYQFRLAEGEKAINRAAAARGGWDSGGTGKALTRYAQDYATGEYGNVYNRLAALAGTGQAATTQTGQFGAGAIGDINNYLTSGAAARGAGAIGGANALTGGVGSLVNYYNQQNLLNALTGAWKPTSGSYNLK